MFQRMALTKLSDWFVSKERKPLIIRGARQTGKTTVVRMLAENIPGYMEVNLEAPGEKFLFTRNLSVDDLVSAIRLKKNTQAPIAESLLFLDEIQACPEAINYLRFLAEQMPELAVIASGSLPEAYIEEEGFEFPVGRVEQTFIYPVTFSEYLGAMGRAEMQSLLQSVPFPDYALKPVYDQYVRYALAGGMPEAVRLLSEGYKLDSLQHFYSSLIQAFQDDVPKYATGTSMRRVIAHCLESTPFYTGSRIKFAGFGSSNYRSREVGEAMRTLRRAMLLQLVYPTSEVTPPAKPNLRKHPKLFFLDSGLLTHSVGLQSDLLGTSDLNQGFRGILAEQQIAQTLLATGGSTDFWTRESRGSSAEVDFLYQNSGMLVPIEVKSGSTGRLRSLHSYIDRCPHGYAVRFYSGPVKIDNLKTLNGKPFKLLNLPHFLCEYLPEYFDWFIREN
ncbi:MAG: AAA family ATPase [Candidatus Fermentibacteria bacterium]|nr:AAA family ATPase [Candidatus Fermentibacteria bacterium]